MHDFCSERTDFCSERKFGGTMNVILGGFGVAENKNIVVEALAQVSSAQGRCQDLRRFKV